MRALKSVTFAYEKREDRILAVINAGRSDAWSCWLTRRLVRGLLERAEEFLASTSALARRAPADVRGDLVAFEREAAMAKTAKGMSRTPADVLKASGAAAALAERLTISSRGNSFRVELRGQDKSGAAGMLARAELQRILQMLQTEVAKADWLDRSAKSSAAPAAPDTGRKPVRH